MAELVGAAADIEQCEAGEGGGRSRPTVLRLRPEARLERFQLLAEGAFAPLRRLSDVIKSVSASATIVSAGMSGDLEAAIECGATHLRIGTALLGDRRPTVL